MQVTYAVIMIHVGCSKMTAHKASVSVSPLVLTHPTDACGSVCKYSSSMAVVSIAASSKLHAVLICRKCGVKKMQLRTGLMTLPRMLQVCHLPVCLVAYLPDSLPGLLCDAG